jgi:poly(3-hydroxybutyrate) depolymerase
VARWHFGTLALFAAMLVGPQTPSTERDLQDSIAVEGATRTYRVFIPETAGRNGPPPAVVLYNGSGSNVEGLMRFWMPVARAEGIVLLGPTAFAPGAWRIPEDSPDFTRDVVEAAKAKYGIDPRRVYLFGHSGGGHHVLQLALLESEYFAAVAAHAGALLPSFYPAIEKARRRIPVAMWIGLDDKIVPLWAVRGTRDALSQAEFAVDLTEMKGHTHSFAERGDEVTRKAWAFLKKQRLARAPVYQPYRFADK